MLEYIYSRDFIALGYGRVQTKHDSRMQKKGIQISRQTRESQRPRESTLPLEFLGSDNQWIIRKCMYNHQSSLLSSPADSLVSVTSASTGVFFGPDASPLARLILPAAGRAGAEEPEAGDRCGGEGDNAPPANR